MIDPISPIKSVEFIPFLSSSFCVFPQKDSEGNGIKFIEIWDKGFKKKQRLSTPNIYLLNGTTTNQENKPFAFLWFDHHLKINSISLIIKAWEEIPNSCDILFIQKYPTDSYV